MTLKTKTFIIELFTVLVIFPVLLFMFFVGEKPPVTSAFLLGMLFANLLFRL